MKSKKQNNGVAKVDVFKVDRSPETMKKVREYFKDIENIHVPYSGVEILKMIRKEKSLT